MQGKGAILAPTLCHEYILDPRAGLATTDQRLKFQSVLVSLFVEMFYAFKTLAMPADAFSVESDAGEGFG